MPPELQPSRRRVQNGTRLPLAAVDPQKLHRTVAACIVPGPRPPLSHEAHSDNFRAWHVVPARVLAMIIPIVLALSPGLPPILDRENAWVRRRWLAGIPTLRAPTDAGWLVHVVHEDPRWPIIESPPDGSTAAAAAASASGVPAFAADIADDVDEPEDDAVAAAAAAGSAVAGVALGSAAAAAVGRPLPGWPALQLAPVAVPIPVGAGANLRAADAFDEKRERKEPLLPVAAVGGGEFEQQQRWLQQALAAGYVRRPEPQTSAADSFASFRAAAVPPAHAFDTSIPAAAAAAAAPAPLPVFGSFGSAAGGMFHGLGGVDHSKRFGCPLLAPPPPFSPLFARAERAFGARLCVQ